MAGEFKRGTVEEPFTPTNQQLLPTVSRPEGAGWAAAAALVNKASPFIQAGVQSYVDNKALQQLEKDLPGEPEGPLPLGSDAAREASQAFEVIASIPSSQISEQDRRDLLAVERTKMQIDEREQKQRIAGDVGTMRLVEYKKFVREHPHLAAEAKKIMGIGLPSLSEFADPVAESMGLGEYVGGSTTTTKGDLGFSSDAAFDTVMTQARKVLTDNDVPLTGNDQQDYVNAIPYLQEAQIARLAEKSKDADAAQNAAVVPVFVASLGGQARERLLNMQASGASEEEMALSWANWENDMRATIPISIDNNTRTKIHESIKNTREAFEGVGSGATTLKAAETQVKLIREQSRYAFLSQPKYAELVTVFELLSPAQGFVPESTKLSLMAGTAGIWMRDAMTRLGTGASTTEANGAAGGGLSRLSQEKPGWVEDEAWNKELRRTVTGDLKTLNEGIQRGNLTDNQVDGLANMFAGYIPNSPQQNALVTKDVADSINSILANPNAIPVIQLAAARYPAVKRYLNSYTGSLTTQIAGMVASTNTSTARGLLIEKEEVGASNVKLSLSPNGVFSFKAIDEDNEEAVDAAAGLNISLGSTVNQLWKMAAHLEAEPGIPVTQEDYSRSANLMAQRLTNAGVFIETPQMVEAQTRQLDESFLEDMETQLLTNNMTQEQVLDAISKRNPELVVQFLDSLGEE